MCLTPISLPLSSGAFWENADTFFSEKKEVTQIMQNILGTKSVHIQNAKANKWERYNPILIGGDLFSFGYLAFQGILSLAPKLQAIASIGMATLVCGEIAGLINIGVAFVCLKEGIQALKNGDYRGGIRLLLDFSCCMGIGVVMILTSLAIKITSIGAVAAFFAANPWVLPLIFFIATLPLLCDLGLRIKDILLSTNLGSKLQLNQLESFLQKKDWEEIGKICKDPSHPFYFDSNLSQEEMAQFFSKKMEQMQADMGVVAAIESFRLMVALQDKNEDLAKTQLTAAGQKIKEWNRAIYVRMFQQILYVSGFGVSMAALSPQVNGGLLNGIQDFCLAAANAIPFYMDVCWPFKRNQLIVVPKVELS